LLLRWRQRRWLWLRLARCFELLSPFFRGLRQLARPDNIGLMSLLLEICSRLLVVTVFLLNFGR
jgi:hypothetical protein